MNLYASAQRDFHFCAAHRLVGHPGKCRYVHGHNYVASVMLSGIPREDGMVCDFADLKKHIGGWIDEKWDHNIILSAKDPLLNVLDEIEYDLVFGDKNPFVMYGNPTAENMAASLANHVNKLTVPGGPLAGLKIVFVRISETKDCAAAIQVEYPTQENL